ncbi:MAG TPA: metalloregulator ArsR/SmtB family transcription factor [Bacillota bacterium]|nr:metalloregulator ArsR/SmtB family transcription factor [Bacillota bacterium]HUM56573.1 metalloregulator ArsR/SmtB family transcription factor [Bacillota bacterium]
MAKSFNLPHDHDVNTSSLLEDIPGDDAFEKASGISALLSDARRLEILWLLCHVEECVINIAAIMKMTSPAICHHLRLLKQSGLIKSRKGGKEVYYSVSDPGKAEALKRLIKSMLEIN